MNGAPHVHTIELSATDLTAVKQVLAEVVARFDFAEDAAFQDEADAYAQELPRALRTGLNDFRLHEPACICLVRGFLVDDDRLGRTPAHWLEHWPPVSTRELDFYLFLCGSLLGSPVAWSTKQRGRMVHTIAPSREDADEQLASGSSSTLTWHTEEAFHPLRSDYLALLCLRNPDAVATTFACVHNLPAEVLGDPVLHEPRFHILPDGSHLSSAPASPVVDIPAPVRTRVADLLARMTDTPEPVPLLFGDPGSPYLRLDQHYTHAAAGDPVAAQALEELMAAVEDGLTCYRLAPGDLCVIDNYKVVHGREAFGARYDGTDRWLRRINVARDLRRSRHARVSAGSRLIV
ncbi:guanitoxin biosynthesis L-enduracididine beta-hydroxylase GntD [Amycolatopsis sp. NPDC051061]|uniref:guanitoxin biosynthesis L-enduracididine beta-hydroxylase GntD n=1 Tax=Amycolatopsis sp. NPDC051061 TaxID=3155042 RepID=UPI00342DC822